MKKLPVASFLLNNILRNIEISNKIEVVDVSLGSFTSKMIISGISQSEFVQLIIQKAYSKMDFILDKVDLSATFEIYGFQLKVYATSKDCCELIYKIPYTDDDCVKKSLSKAILNIIKENHTNDVESCDISLIKTSLDALNYSVGIDNPEKLVETLMNDYDTINNEWKDDHKGNSYRIVTLDLGLFSIVVNNQDEINHNITILL